MAVRLQAGDVFCIVDFADYSPYRASARVSDTFLPVKRIGAASAENRRRSNATGFLTALKRSQRG
jgi:hypothetical protein